MTDALIELDIVDVSGSPRELGRGQGEALRPRIQKFVQMRLDAMAGYFAERGQQGHERVPELGAAGLKIYAEWDPEGYEEHLGLAEAADIAPELLWTVTNMTDFRDAVILAAPSGPPIKPGQKEPDEGCTSVLVPGSHTKDGNALVGQTWDLNPPDLEYVVGVRRRPSAGPQTFSVTCAGCLSLVGMNEHGLCVGTTNIKTYGSCAGVGYLGILHAAIRQPDALAAKQRVETAPHAGAHTYWLADAELQLEWEASPNGAFLRTTAQGPLGRSNHCLAEPHIAIQGELASESSLARVARVPAFIEAKQPSGGMDVEAMQALFASREDGLYSINRYPEDNQGTATNAVFVARPAERRAWTCRGPSDRGRWVEIDFR